MNFLILLVKNDRDGLFNVGSSCSELLNGYVTREDYLYFLSKANPILKQLKRYRRLTYACAILAPLLGIAVFVFGIFWRVYFDTPFWTYILVELVVP
jgi:hypothetical protein